MILFWLITSPKVIQPFLDPKTPFTKYGTGFSRGSAVNDKGYNPRNEPTDGKADRQYEELGTIASSRPNSNTNRLEFTKLK